MLETIISLGDGIGIENPFERHRRLGCQGGQGFLLSPAVPIDQVIAILREGK